MVTIAVFDLAFQQPIGFLFAARDISYRVWKAILGIRDLGKRKFLDGIWNLPVTRDARCGILQNLDAASLKKERDSGSDSLPPPPPAPFQNLFISITKLIPRAFAPRSYFLRGWG